MSLAQNSEDVEIGFFQKYPLARSIILLVYPDDSEGKLTLLDDPYHFSGYLWDAVAVYMGDVPL